MRTAILWSVCVAASSGCSMGSPERNWSGEIRDSAGVALVESPNEGIWAPDEMWRLEEELRIGGSFGDPEYHFGQVGSIAVNSVGEILVMDRQLRQLRIYGPQGDFVRDVGSAGEGPGTFGLGVTDVIVAAGDTLLVPDVRNRTVHRFSAEGIFLASASLDLAQRRALRFQWDPASGRAAVQLRPVRVLAQDSGPTEDEIRLLESSGELGEVLLRVPSGELLGPGGIRYFTPEPSWALGDSSTVLYGVNRHYLIGVYDEHGRPVRYLSRRTEPRPITDRDIRAFFAYLDRAWLDAGLSPSALPARHRSVSFAEVFPAFSMFRVGPEGTIWVQPVRAPGELSDDEIARYNFLEDFGASAWDVFDREGRLLGVVEMPPRFQPRLFVGDAIYGVSRDEFDVQSVVRLRIVRHR